MPPRALAAALLACLALLTMGVGAAAADSATPAPQTTSGWTFWRGIDRQWVASEQPPDGVSVVEGSVLGWRYGSDQPPQSPARFVELCDSGLKSGKGWSSAVQVAVIIDVQPGDVPAGQTAPEALSSCVAMPQLSDGADALAAARMQAIQAGVIQGSADERTRLGLSADDAVIASTPLPESAAGTSSLPSWLPWAAGLASLAVVGALLAFGPSRRRPVS